MNAKVLTEKGVDVGNGQRHTKNNLHVIHCNAHMEQKETNVQLKAAGSHVTGSLCPIIGSVCRQRQSSCNCMSARLSGKIPKLLFCISKFYTINVVSE